MTETIGERLKRARAERHLTLQQVADITRVRPHYLEALERGDLSAIPSTAQARGFLRIYADFLGLRPDELVPAVRPPETQPASPAPASSADLPTPPAESSLSPSTEAAKPRSNFLTSLRQRFARRSEAQTEASHTAASEPESVQPAALESKPFIPVRSREELPAPITPIGKQTKPEAESKGVGASVKGKAAGSRKPAAQSRASKKPALKTDGSSESNGDKRTTLKKKVKVK